MTRMQNFLSQSDDQGEEERKPEGEAAPQNTQEVQTSEQPESQATELTAEDIPDEGEEQPAVDAFEIVHNGQQVKLSREDVIRHAQQGFDYTHKTQAVAEKERQVVDRLARLAEVEQVQPHLVQFTGQIAAFEAQLRPYLNVDWVQLATDDPMGYPRHRATYDTLVQAYQGAVGQYQQANTIVQEQVRKVRNDFMREQEAELPKFIPEWKDPAKKEAGKQAMAKYLTDIGADPRAVKAKLDDALSMSIVFKAMRYDQLLQSKAGKVKQLRTAPPVTRPGAAQTPDAQRTSKSKELETNLRKSGDLKDAAALLANRWK